MSTTVKICGIQCGEVLQSMLNLPIDQIGFVFAKSKRQVDPSNVGEWVSRYREAAAADSDAPGARALMVGVFVDAEVDELSRTAEAAKLDVVQLHGKETPEFCREAKERLGLRVYKALAVKSDDGANPKPEELLGPYVGIADTILLDTYDPHAEGGTGRSFDWTVLPPYAEYAVKHGLHLIVAGGLNAGNVSELIEEYRPGGVDVSSGVEQDGHKDMAKITSFVERVKKG